MKRGRTGLCAVAGLAILGGAAVVLSDPFAENAFVTAYNGA